jgi:hypothetical protein
MKSFQSSYGRVWHLEWWQRCNLACVAALRERRACMHETPCLAVFTRSPREREIWLVQNEKYANLCQNNHWLIAWLRKNTADAVRWEVFLEFCIQRPSRFTFKESQSTKMHCALKCFHCFVFRHFVSQFIDEILTSETYRYQSALFLDNVIFSIVGIC